MKKIKLSHVNFEIMLNETYGNILIHGKAGTGKSTVINNLISDYPNESISVIKGLGDKSRLEEYKLETNDEKVYIGNLEESLGYLKKIADDKLSSGNRSDKLLVVIEEADSVFQESENACELMNYLLELGPAVGIHFIIGVQRKNKTIKFERIETEIETFRTNDVFSSYKVNIITNVPFEKVNHWK